MTRSYGSGPGGPGGYEPNPRDKDQPPELQEVDADADHDLGTPAAPTAGWAGKLDRMSRYSASAKKAITPVRVDTGKRLVALIIDVAAAVLIAEIVSLLPVVNNFFVQDITIALVLLCRDYFFGGRGVGKNLMGLQVVDVMTGEPLSFIQTLKRNLVILGPILILFILKLVLHIIPVPVVTDAVWQILTVAGEIYVLFVLPYEAYRVYTRADGTRFGDQLAGTAVIEAPMDFSTPLPRH
jgi:hypothetical protein